MREKETETREGFVVGRFRFAIVRRKRWILSLDIKTADAPLGQQLGVLPLSGCHGVDDRLKHFEVALGLLSYASFACVYMYMYIYEMRREGKPAEGRSRQRTQPLPVAASPRSVPCPVASSSAAPWSPSG